MNTAWFEEYLSDEWFSWDTSTFNKYQLTEKDIFFGWWLTGDIQDSKTVIDEIFQLIEAAKKAEPGEFLGKAFEAIFTEDKIYLVRSKTKEQFQYSLLQIEAALQEWEFILNQSSTK